MSERFRQAFGDEPKWRCFAPARINLIGEHIDYCGGSVLPMAIKQGTTIYGRANQSSELCVYSERFGERYSLDLNNILLREPDSHRTNQTGGSWHDYVLGVAASLSVLDQSPLKGMNLQVAQNIGSAGLSSSASFCVALAKALVPALSGEPLARLCQQVEHSYAGVNCGIMDQMAIVHGGVMKLDCATLEMSTAQWDTSAVTLVVMDTHKPRTLAGSAYNQRVAELTDIVTAKGLGGLDQLATTDISTSGLTDLQRRRLHHVQSEQQRVVDAFECMGSNDWVRLGALMNSSHDSLKNACEVSCDELDLMVSLACDQPGVFGARMTGGGFGGCAIAISEPATVDSWLPVVAARYTEVTGTTPDLYVVEPSPGAAFVEIDAEDL